MNVRKTRNTIIKLTVIAVSGGFVAALALPANAFNNHTSEVPAAATAPRVEAAQTATVSPTIELAVSRDSYTATKPVVTAPVVNSFVTLNPPAQAYSGQAIVDFAMQFVGVVPYGTGNSPTTSFSCDGFTQYVFGKFGIPLPRIANVQARHFVAISPADALPGDILWWPGQHVAIYTGGGMMVDSPTWGRYVEHHGIWGNPVYMRLG